MKIDLGKVSCRGARVLEADERSCTVELDAAGGGVAFHEAEESGERYVIGDVEVLEDHSAAMMFRCFTPGEERERIFMRFGLLPRFKTRICLDLDLLDNRTIFTNRTPGMLKLVVHGHRVERADVSRFELGVERTYHNIRVRLTDFRLSDEPPESFPIPDAELVDEFGQWKGRDWPGKTHSLEEMRERLSCEEGVQGYPFPDWDRWGGCSTRKLQDGTGFFTTVKTPDGRWHLADPDGFDFFSVGPCCVNPGEWGRVDGFEKTLDWFPEGEPEYAEFFHNQRGRRAAYMPEDSARMVNYTGISLKRLYGEQWREKWEEITLNILMKNGINSRGNFSGLSTGNGTSKIPYVRELPGFPTTKTLIFRDFPDVLSPEYRQNAEQYASRLAEWRDDRWLIGYFLRNEPEFNFVEGLAIADEVLRNPAQTCCREGLIQYLREKYRSISALNCAWGTSFDSFDCLTRPVDACSTRYPGSREDIREFSRRLLREYIKAPSLACRKADPNHLNLGLRWSQANNVDMLAGWEYFDVFSLNCYAFDPTAAMDFVKNAGVDLPILIGEFHCGALDRGLTATGLKGVRNQRERGVMWRHYVEKCAAHPSGVGAHWFQLNDQFCLGRYDGENYQIGMMDICMNPYPELMEAVLQTSGELYRVRNGEIPPCEVTPEAVPMIGY